MRYVRSYVRSYVLSSVLVGVLSAQQTATGPGDVLRMLTGGGNTATAATRRTRKSPTTIKGNIAADVSKEPISMGPRSVEFLPDKEPPNIPCTFGRLCEIWLEPGEFIPDLTKKGEPILADSDHWTYYLRVTGTADTKRLAIVTKVAKVPVGLASSDLIVTTDRREYHLTLVYDAQNYAPRTEFSYPLDEARKSVLAYNEEQARKRMLLAPLPVQVIHRNYRLIVGKHVPDRLAPQRVTDDGEKTTLLFSKEILKWDTPVLRVATPNGCEEATYHPFGTKWVVDNLFNEALLTVGTGKHAQRVRILRGNGPSTHTCGKAFKGQTIDLSARGAE